MICQNPTAQATIQSSIEKSGWVTEWNCESFEAFSQLFLFVHNLYETEISAKSYYLALLYK